MSQKKHKVLRKKQKRQQPAKSAKQKSRFSFAGIAFSAVILVLISCFGIGTVMEDRNGKLQPTDFTIEAPQSVALDQAKDVFIKVVNSLPDKKVKESLIADIRSGQLRIGYQNSGLFAVEGRKRLLSVNPEKLVNNQDNLGYLESFLVHEHYHWQDWLGNNPNSSMYRSCELEAQQSKACQLEWWDAEWRAVKAQAEFLRKYDYLAQMSTGPHVNNRAIFTDNDPQHAALEYLRINYYIGHIIDDPQLRQVFPEFYQNKIREIEAVN